MAPNERNAVRFGRVPKREKARIQAAMQCVNAHSANKNLQAELCDLSKVTTYIVDSFNRSCIFTYAKIEELMKDASNKPTYSHFKSKRCPLNPDCEVSIDGSTVQYGNFNDIIKGLVEFAKGLPGFRHVSNVEKIEILRTNAFEGLLLQLVGLFDHDNDTILCMNGRYMKKDAVYANSNSRCLMDSMFSFAQRFKVLGIHQEELALLTAVVLVNPDRPNIRKNEHIEYMHNCYKVCLDNLLTENHGEGQNIHSKLLGFIPDLRTLSTLHSERYPKETNNHTDSAESYDESRSFLDDRDVSMDSTYSYYNDEPMESNESESVSGENYSDSLSYGNNMFSTDSRSYMYWKNEHGDNLQSQRDESSDLLIKCPHYKRKVDSPNDSGIESDKTSTASMCSSPNCLPEDKIVEEDKEELPLLRRALEAPPLMNADLMLGVSYKPHKKFRALQRDEDPLNQCMSRDMLSGGYQSPTSSSSLLASALTTPTLSKSLSENPKISEESMKKSDALHAAMIKTEALRHKRSSLLCPENSYSPSPEMFHSNDSSFNDNRNPGLSVRNQQRTHIITEATPSMYYEHNISSPQTSITIGAHVQPEFVFGNSKLSENERSFSPVSSFAYDISDAQPLNLSKKTPPPNAGLLVEA